MVVKIFVLIPGAGRVANLWEAVIADVGVALLAILNAVRRLNYRYNWQTDLLGNPPSKLAGVQFGLSTYF